MPSNLNGSQRVAVVLAQLDATRAGKLLAAMSESEVVDVMAAMATLPVLDHNQVTEVLTDFTVQASALLQVGQGGMDVARKLLHERLGDARADEVLEQLVQGNDSYPLAFLRRLDASQIARLINDEHPQIIAVIVAHLPPETAAQLVATLDDPVQADVVARIATMGRISPEAIQQVAQILDRRAASLVHGAVEATPAGGITPTVAILNHSDRSIEKQILADLDESDPVLAERIRNEMFTFDDLVDLDDRTMQTILRHVIGSELAVALKGVHDDIRQKFLRNLSQRAAADLVADIEYLGPTRLSEVETAQRAVVRVVRDLDTAGEIILGRDEEFV